jgi:hypothetical protein
MHLSIRDGLETAIDGLNGLVGLTTVFRRMTDLGSLEAANDNDPFVGAFEKAAGTEKRHPFGESFGELPRLLRSDKDKKPNG